MKEYIGLSSEEAIKLLKEFGPNSIEVKKQTIFKKFFRWMISPISLMLLVAASLSLIVGRTADFWIILFLFLSNFAITSWHENKADKSIKKLEENLSVKIKVVRGGKWQLIDSINLVVGDVVELQTGSVVPADIEILEAKNLSIDESVLTGESLPKEKKVNDKAFSGSFVSTGYAMSRITAIGSKTYFGKTLSMIDKTPRKSALEKDILSISEFLSLASILIVIVLTFVLLRGGTPFIEILTLDLSLLIAGIPVALPTVMSLIISIGVLNLSKDHAIVRRLSSLEDLANVDLLLSDKTGTLTQNKIHIEDVIVYGNYTRNEILALSLSTIFNSDLNSIDNAIKKISNEENISPFKVIDFIPADSKRKRSYAVVELDGKKSGVSLGASQVIRGLCKLDKSGEDFFESKIKEASLKGFRVLALAVNRNNPDEKDMEFLGMLFLGDRLYSDTKETIKFMKDQGIGVKMLTGDSIEISSRIAQELDLKGLMAEKKQLSESDDYLIKNLDSFAGFAQVLPEDKYRIVGLAREAGYIVSVTGDGVNDIPAVKSADVGFAVSHAVDALKGAADIVLISEGISVIKGTIIEARRIFSRLYNYSVYRMSESFRIIITIAVIGFLFKMYPLTPIQLIILALLNDLPIISLAFDKVKTSLCPTHVDVNSRFTLSALFGLAGIANSLSVLFVSLYLFNLSWPVIQTIFFLKLTVSGHMLIYVAHTKERWFKFLPSWQVMVSTFATQIVATIFALVGIFMIAIPLRLVIFVWIWSFFWMQISELFKVFLPWILKEERLGLVSIKKIRSRI